MNFRKENKLHFSKQTVIISFIRASTVLEFYGLTLIRVGFLGARFEVVWGGKSTPYLKLVRIMLET